jgi:hypothetical protein
MIISLILGWAQRHSIKKFFSDMTLSADELYLSGATDVVDLEYRMRELDQKRLSQSFI